MLYNTLDFRLCKKNMQLLHILSSMLSNLKAIFMKERKCCMKKFLCTIIGLIMMMALVSCVPPQNQTDYQKEMKEKFKEENAELEEILKSTRIEETQED